LKVLEQAKSVKISRADLTAARPDKGAICHEPAIGHLWRRPFKENAAAVRVLKPSQQPIAS